MSGGIRDRAAALFFALAQIPADDRAAWLDEKCGADAALRSEVERLLANLDLADSLAPPAPETAGEEGDLARPAGSLVGDFVIIRRIGAGGTGVVHLAQQRYPPRIVALKMLRREHLASAARRRFEIEAELLAHLDHPGIAEIYTAHPGDDATPPFIAMELVSGPPITEYADAAGLGVRERVALVALVCDAMQHAHQRGVIHRDLKPGNILVGADGQPKILDFGVARRLERASPETIAAEMGQLVGTVAYMSPEQLQAIPDAIDTRTDIYAIGVILFRLLAGQLPFAHDNPSLPELARRIAHDEPPRLGAIRPNLGGDLEAIVACALAKEKERRYDSIAGMAADLRRYLDGQPISASADTAWSRVRRQVGRYRAALGAAVVVAIGVGGLAVYATLQRARADRMNAELQRQLSTSVIERGRLLSMNGNQPVAEQLVWREYFRQPESRLAQWTLWEIYSREPSLWTKVDHEGGTQSLRFSPDGRLLATAGRTDGTVHLIDVESGRLVQTLAPSPKSGIRRALFTADGHGLVTGSDDGTLRLWDTATGTLRHEIPRAVERLHDLAVTADGTTVVTVAWGEAQVWSLATGRRLADLPSVQEKVSTGAASPVSPLVALGTDDGSLAAINVERRTVLWKVRAHAGLVSSVVVSADGATIASGGTDGMIRVWRTSTGERLHAVASQNGRVRSLSFDHSGRRLAAAGEWRTRVWNLETPTAPLQDVGGSEGTSDVHFRPDGTALATCHGGSGLVRLWNLAADARLRHWATGLGGMVGLDVSPLSGALLLAGSSGRVETWRAGDAGLRPVLTVGGSVGGFTVSGNGRWLATVGLPASAAIWDARDGRRLASPPDARAARSVVFVNDDRTLAYGGGDGTVVLWDWTDTGPASQRLVTSTDTEVLAIAAHGPRLFVAHRNRTVVVREATSGRELHRFQASASPFSLAVSPDGRLLAAGTYLGDVDVWNVETNENIGGLRGQTALIGGLAFSPDGALLAVASRSGVTQLWDVESRQVLAQVGSRPRGAERVRFMPDGRVLAIGYTDGEAELIDLDYYFRYAAGNAEYQLRLFRDAGEMLPRAPEVLSWSQRILSAAALR